MIARRYILATLKELDKKYVGTTSPKEALFYSKLAVLELCGWVEEAMDDIVLRCARRHLAVRGNITFFEKRVVEKTWGFDYQQNFRKMLIQLLGIINVERIEKGVDQSKLMALRATLGGLKALRDPVAHTHIKGVTRRINAPSVTLSQFPALYEGLLELSTVLRRTRFKVRK